MSVHMYLKYIYINKYMKDSKYIIPLTTYP